MKKKVSIRAVLIVVLVIACGLAYGKDDFDLKELLKLADDRMYENKVAIKLSRGEDPNAR